MTPPRTPPIHIASHVAAALAEGKPVVALESTIISHGMPFPRNVAVAQEVEQIVSDGGATPATIGIISGVPTVGLDDDQLELLGRDDDVRKVSVRDLPLVMSEGAHGATTVAATMRLAAAAGIDVFVTGGIGGVHRGAQQSMDISADLLELGRTAVAVVCAGVKSILDIPLTLEVLETQGVPVVVVDADDFPSFYSRDSGLPAPARVDGPEGVARAIHAARSLGLAQGMVVATPIPASDEVPREQMDAVIGQALIEVGAHGISGAATTPWLLQRIVELTGGASLEANIALVRHNARVGTAIAVALTALRA